jgi:hypothetical protein
MTSRKELVELVQDLPADDTWLDKFMERLKEKDPLIYGHVVASAKRRLAELDEGKT